MVIDDQNNTKIAVVQPSTGKGGSIMKKKRKIHIGTDKSARKASKYSTETISLVGLVLVALLNLHLHYNVSFARLLTIVYCNSNSILLALPIASFIPI